MPIVRLSHFTRQRLRSEPHALFVFGDNLARKGFGGQAKECRGEPNAVGIPTKKSPAMRDDAFFSDKDFAHAKSVIDQEFGRLARHLAEGGVVVLPTAGLGTGLAQLPSRAPRIHDYILRCIQRCEEISQAVSNTPSRSPS